MSAGDEGDAPPGTTSRPPDTPGGVLAETIRSWDWRSDQSDADEPTPASAPATRAAPTNHNWALAGIGAACVVLAVVVAIAIAVSSGRTNAPVMASQASAQQHAVAAAEARDLATVEGATRTADAAGTAVSDGFANLKGLPTPHSVSAVIDPYLTALVTYQGVLAGAHLPSSTVGPAHAVSVQLSMVIAFLQTLATVNPADLGTWINDYYLHTAQFQSAITHFENVVPA